MTGAEHFIEELTERSLPAALTLLDEALRPGHTLEWFRWKHMDTPAGASWGWVARAGDDVLGVRLVMRWPISIDGEPSMAARMVDTATRASHRGGGIFRSLTLYALERLAGATDPPRFVMNTPNAKSGPGYVRMGWALLPRIAHAYHLVFPSLGTAGVESCFPLEGWPTHFEESPGLSTRRSAAFMRWRYQAAPGGRYRWLRLREAERDNGLIYRIRVVRGLRLLLVMELVGSIRERALLLAAAARRERAILALAPAGAGAWVQSPPSGRIFLRGGSVLAVRDLPPPAPPTAGAFPCSDPREINCWGLSLGDLEDVL